MLWPTTRAVWLKNIIVTVISYHLGACVDGPVRPRVHTTHTIWYVIYVAMKRAVTMVDEGCPPKIILGILSVGLLPALFPNFIEWSLPPLCESVRRKTQRRSIPAGKYF